MEVAVLEASIRLLHWMQSNKKANTILCSESGILLSISGGLETRGSVEQEDGLIVSDPAKSRTRCFTPVFVFQAETSAYSQPFQSPPSAASKPHLHDSTTPKKGHRFLDRSTLDLVNRALKTGSVCRSVNSSHNKGWFSHGRMRSET